MAENTAQSNPSPKNPLIRTPRASRRRRRAASRKGRRRAKSAGGRSSSGGIFLLHRSRADPGADAPEHRTGAVDGAGGRERFAERQGGGRGLVAGVEQRHHGDGLKVYEDKEGKNLILQASRARTELSLLKAIKSGFTEIAAGADGRR